MGIIILYYIVFFANLILWFGCVWKLGYHQFLAILLCGQTHLDGVLTNEGFRVYIAHAKVFGQAKVFFHTSKPSYPSPSGGHSWWLLGGMAWDLPHCLVEWSAINFNIFPAGGCPRHRYSPNQPGMGTWLRRPEEYLEWLRCNVLEREVAIESPMMMLGSPCFCWSRFCCCNSLFWYGLIVKFPY